MSEQKKQGAGFPGAFKNLGFASRLTGTDTSSGGALNVRTSPVRFESSAHAPRPTVRRAHDHRTLPFGHTAD